MTLQDFKILKRLGKYRVDTMQLLASFIAKKACVAFSLFKDSLTNREFILTSFFLLRSIGEGAYSSVYSVLRLSDG